MIDTHCHLDSPRFGTEREAVFERAKASGVTDVIIPSVGPESWQPLLDWADGRDGVHVALGIHPQLLPELPPEGDDRHLARLEELLRLGKAIAIGECGLDGGSVALGAPMVRQLRVLRAHLALARRFRLPVLLHCLKAHEPLLGLLAEEALPAGGVLHSYSGSAEQVRDYLPQGLHFSMAGAITYERAKKPVLAVRAIPPELLLVETDAPDQTPRPFEGRNEPAFLVQIVEAVARARGESAASVGELTAGNARRLFGLRPPSPLTSGLPRP